MHPCNLRATVVFRYVAALQAIFGHECECVAQVRTNYSAIR